MPSDEEKTIRPNRRGKADPPRSGAGDSRRPRLLFLVSEDWYFVSHRLPMARAARNAGFEVAVATNVGRHREAIEAEGIRVIDIPLRRSSLNPWRELVVLAAIVRAYAREGPDIVHHVALKPTIYGSIAARLTGVERVANALAGLGYVFISDRLLAKVLRPLAVAVFRFLFNRLGSVLILQNEDDERLFAEARIVDRDRIVRIRGSGVDVDRFASVGPPPQSGPVVVAYVGRMIADKGVATLIDAWRLLVDRGSEIRLLLCGTPDPQNPGSISEDRLRAWAREPGVEWLGEVDDIAALWRRAHIAVLASKREGLPLSLLEAAAAGRPIVASDVPGCREIAREGENALLFPVGDAAALAASVERLAGDRGLRERFGEASRRLVSGDLSARAVGLRTVELYRQLVGQAEAGR